MDIFISACAKVKESVVAPWGSGSLISYKDNFNELRYRVMELQDARERIRYLVEDGQRNGNEIKHDVLYWLDRSDRIIEAAEQLQEDPGHAKVRCSCPNFLIRHQLSRNAKKMAAEIKMQGEVVVDQVAEELPAAPVSVGFTSVTRGIGIELESRESVKNDILEALIDPEVSMVGVYGMGGVGKTFLVKEVAHKAVHDKLFDVVVVAIVSQTPDFRRIQGQIADQLGLRLEEETAVGRAYRLQARIRHERTILIILDDIWEALDLERVGIPFGDDHKGCKVLLTTRNQYVLRRMEAQIYFRLEVLNEQETWRLFASTAGDDVEDPDLRHIAIRVAEACSGLPLLLIKVARKLRNMHRYFWIATLDQLEGFENKEEEDDTYSALELSYNYLQNDEVKSVFLLCGVLGQCSVSELLRNGMGLGIFKMIDNMEEARNRLYAIIEDLKASSLLLELEDTESIKMLGIVRQVAISIASRHHSIFIMKVDAELQKWPLPNILIRCTHIILDRCYIQELPMRLDCPNLRLLYLNSSNNRSSNIPDSFFEGMSRLQVLNLTCMNLSFLPASIRLLLHLKTLGLEQCALKDMRIIGALKNLEILSFTGSSTTELPSEIVELTRLRMLDLSGSIIKFIAPNIISNLIRLEELYMGNTAIEWVVVDSIGHLSYLSALEIQIPEGRDLPRNLMFEKLVRYNIVVGNVSYRSYTRFGITKTLKLNLQTYIHLDSAIKALIQTVEDLYLEEIDGISNILYQLNEEGFPLLKHLHIQDNEKIQHIINSAEWNQAGVCFPILETLELDNLSYLDKICNGPLPINSFSKLRSIKVRNCGRLQNLFRVSMVEGLSQLLEIEVLESNSMKEIVTGGSDDNVDSDTTVNNDAFQGLRSLTLQMLPELLGFYFGESRSSETPQMPFFNAKTVLPRLERLKLSSLNLKKIWDEDQLSTASLNNLTILIVEDCGDMKYLFSSSMVGSLSNLKRFEVSKFHNMEKILNATEKGTNKDEVLFPNLETIIISEMENLKTIWQWHQQPAPKSFGKLNRMEVKNCEKLVTILSIKNS